MIRVVVISSILAGCTQVPVTAYNVKGEELPNTYLIMAPLCLFICPVTVTTTGSDVDTIGAGASGSNTQSPTVSTNTGANS